QRLRGERGDGRAVPGRSARHRVAERDHRHGLRDPGGAGGGEKRDGRDAAERDHADECPPEPTLAQAASPVTRGGERKRPPSATLPATRWETFVSRAAGGSGVARTTASLRRRSPRPSRPRK